MRTRSWLSIAVAAPAAVVVALSSYAWACNPNPYMNADPESGRPGTSVNLTGDILKERPIEIRWDDYSGPVLATAQGPKFSVTVAVPSDAAAGAHMFLAVAYDETGRIDSTTRAVFEVTEPEGSNPQPPVQQPKDDSKAPGGSDKPRNSDSGRSSTGGDTSARREQPTTSTRSTSTSVAQPVAPSRPNGSEGKQKRKSRDEPAESAAKPQPAPALTNPWASAQADLDRAPSLTEPVGHQGPAPALLIGVGLLGAGLVMLLGGTLVAELRRNRARADSNQD